MIGGRGAAARHADRAGSSRSTRHAAGSGPPALASPRSDLAAVALGSRILLAGGRGAGGTEAALSELAAHARDRSATALRGARRATPRGNVYADDGAERPDRRRALARPLVYVPNSESDTVDVIDPTTFRVVEHFAVGRAAPARRAGLGPEDALRRQRPRQQPDADRPANRQARRRPIPVDDPYNMYFTPDGRYAIVVAERLQRLDFRDPHTFGSSSRCAVPCRGVDHMDFTADGRFAARELRVLGQMVVVDVAASASCARSTLPDGAAAMPQDVKLSPDGRDLLRRRHARRRRLGDRRAHATACSASSRPAPARTASTRAATRRCSTSPTAARARSP